MKKMKRIPVSKGTSESACEKKNGKGLLETAKDLESEQQSLLEAATIEQAYQEALSVYVQEKRNQVERIENKLEHLINQQRAHLQKIQANPPGIFTMPSTRRTWQNRQTQQRARLQILNSRLEAVREIKIGMGLYSYRIEELATRKLRAKNPDLAAGWVAMREAERREKLVKKKAVECHGQSQSKTLDLRFKLL